MDTHEAHDIKTALVILPPPPKLGIYRYFLLSLIDSFRRLGIECIVAEKDKDSLFRGLMLEAPDFSICFNGLNPDPGGECLADKVEIPHVAAFLDPPTRFYQFLESKFTIATFIDRFFCQFYEMLKKERGMPPHVLFLPHAVQQDLHVPPERSREYDITFMATCYDFEGDRKKWKERHAQDVCRAMDEAIEITFVEPYTSFIDAFMRTLKDRRVNVENLDWQEVFYDLETYIKGKDRVALLQAVSRDHAIHIFGNPQKDVGWEYYFPKGTSNVTLHNGVSIEEAVEVMKRSKVILNTCPTVKDGTHERNFFGLACGALTCTHVNKYMQEQFKDGEGVLFYPFSDRSQINAQLDKYLRDESARCEAVNKGYALVKRNHTWDSRVKLLQEQLPPILKQLNS